MRTRLASLALAVLALACGRTDGYFVIQDASVPGSTAPRDAGVRVDAGSVVDAEPPDAGAPVDTTLAEVLTCDLDEQEALHAAAAYVACFEGTTMVSVMEAYEGFLFGSLDPFAAAFAGLPTACGLWQCAAEARSCQQLNRCLATTAVDIADCAPTSRECVGDLLAVCIGPLTTRHVDCGRLGARCEEGACVRDDCRFGDGANPPTCEADSGALTLCGDLALDCTAWRGEPSRCASLYVQGEAPVAWCAPEDVGSVPGLYNQPVECDRGGDVRFTTVSGREYEVDCFDVGFGGCDERGCTR